MAAATTVTCSCRSDSRGRSAFMANAQTPDPKTLGMIGLGRMGGNMAERLRRAGHTVLGYDRSAESAREVATIGELVGKLPAPRLVWVMVPAGPPTYETVDTLGSLLSPGDVVVDGGNSRYTDDIRHAEDLAEKGIGFVDCGVSGGVWGLTEGYALMCGGDDEHVALVQPIFDTLKPEGDSRSEERRVGKECRYWWAQDH